MKYILIMDRMLIFRAFEGRFVFRETFRETLKGKFIIKHILINEILSIKAMAYPLLFLLIKHSSNKISKLIEY